MLEQFARPVVAAVTWFPGDPRGVSLAVEAGMSIPSSLLAILVIAMPALARADAAAKATVENMASDATSAETEGMVTAVSGDPSECSQAVRAGAGIAPTDTFVGLGGATMSWRRAPEVCARYAKLHALGKVVAQLAPSLQAIAAFDGLRKADGSPDPSVRGDAYRVSVEAAKQCVKVIDEATGRGVIGDVAFAPNGIATEPKYTLVAARKRCGNWVAYGSGAAIADDKRVAAELAALKAKYGKLGITGDRLDYLVKNGHRTQWGVGCVELAGKTLKSSPVFYELGQDDLAWIVYKTEFSGDKQIRYTSRRYRKDGNWACK
jgi:hypothetical protein